MSTLPPLSTIATRLPAKRCGWLSTTARPTAADGGEQEVRGRVQLFRQFQRGGALADDHIGVVVGRDKAGAGTPKWLAASASAAA
jgi:hypothetical protein